MPRRWPARRCLLWGGGSSPSSPILGKRLKPTPPLPPTWWMGPVRWRPLVTTAREGVRAGRRKESGGLSEVGDSAGRYMRWRVEACLKGLCGSTCLVSVRIIPRGERERDGERGGELQLAVLLIHKLNKLGGVVHPEEPRCIWLSFGVLHNDIRWTSKHFCVIGFPSLTTKYFDWLHNLGL